MHYVYKYYAPFLNKKFSTWNQDLIFFHTYSSYLVQYLEIFLFILRTFNFLFNEIKKKNLFHLSTIDILEGFFILRQCHKHFFGGFIFK